MAVGLTLGMAVGLTLGMAVGLTLGMAVGLTVRPAVELAHWDGVTPGLDPAARAKLAVLVRELAVVRGGVVLTSGAVADYYVDLRRVTLHHAAAPLVGRLLRELTADWDYVAVGGLTLGADPVAAAVLHAPGRPVDAFVVRRSVKRHGMARRVEGPDVAGRRVLAVEDTATTGASVLTAVAALQDAGAHVVGVATVVDRDTGARQAVQAHGLAYRSILGRSDLGVT